MAAFGKRATTGDQIEMKAVVYEQYGSPDVLTLREIEKPTPKAGEVLIKVYATSVTAGDWRLRKADPFLARLFNGLFRPVRVKILGFEVAGIIEKVGSEVATFREGDAVFAFCGLRFGGYAEYCCLKEKDVLVHKPRNLTFEQAATVPLGALTALYFLRKADLKRGQKILIYGASGSVGTFAIQLANYYDAEVTAACSSRNKEFVKSVGADCAIDYLGGEFNDLPKQFDVVFDAVGKMKKSTARKVLKSGGKLVSVTGKAKPTKLDLGFIKALVEVKRLTPFIDRTYNLTAIKEAHRYVEQFRKRGNVAVRVAGENDQPNAEGL